MMNQPSVPLIASMQMVVCLRQPDAIVPGWTMKRLLFVRPGRWNGRQSELHLASPEANGLPAELSSSIMVWYRPAI